MADDAIVIDTSPTPRCGVIWMHGLGADGSDFEPIVPHLGLSPTLGVRFKFPHAPVQPVTINGGVRMRAWYDIRTPDFTTREDAQGLAASAAALGRWIEAFAEEGIPSERIVVAGFSQGGAIALHGGLAHPQPLAGILALSTYLPLAETFERHAHAANRQTPIFMAHGSGDPVIPIGLAEASRSRLKQMGYAVDFHTYPMAHSVAPEEIRDIGLFLNRQLAPANSREAGA